MAINGVGLAAVAGGAVVLYGGIAGKSPLQALYTVVHGGDPRTVKQTQAITAASISRVNGGNAAVAVSAAYSQIGKPYAWDTPLNLLTPNPKSFDCSGLTGWCYAKAGVKLSHNAASQLHELKSRPLAEAQPGDLVFFGIPVAPHHVGIYVGNGQIIEAPTYGIPVRVRDISASSPGIIGHVGVFPVSAATDPNQVNNSPGATSGTQAIAQSLMPQYGFSGADQWSALQQMWTRESGWSPFADTRKTGLDAPDAHTFAYGIPQARPATKLPLAGRPADLGGQSDATAQIKWGLGYIRGRYGDPVKAWAFWQTNGYY